MLKNFKWDGIETLVYKQDGSPFKDVTRQVLYDGAYDIPCQFRYFECLPGGIFYLGVSRSYAYGYDISRQGASLIGR